LSYLCCVVRELKETDLLKILIEFDAVSILGGCLVGQRKLFVVLRICWKKESCFSQNESGLTHGTGSGLKKSCLGLHFMNINIT
jgi:hypothetical protein